MVGIPAELLTFLNVCSPSNVNQVEEILLKDLRWASENSHGEVKCFEHNLRAVPQLLSFLVSHCFYGLDYIVQPWDPKEVSIAAFGTHLVLLFVSL